MVSVTANAYIFPKPIVIDDVTRVTKSYGRDIDTIIHYTKANIEGNPEKICSFWIKDARPSIKEMVEDPDLLARNTEFFSKNRGVKIIGVIDQGMTKTILQERFSMIMGINVTEQDGHVYLTNLPANDLALAIIEASFLSDYGR